MINLNRYNLNELVSSFNDENDFYSIRYSFIDTPIDPHIEFENTSSVMARALLSVSNKISGESISMPVDLMQVPLVTSMGTKIDGTFYEVCSTNSRANGWYNLYNKNKGYTLELVPLTGRAIKFSENKGIISVLLGSKLKEIPLGIYLKAISGLSYKELIRKIGYKNTFITKSLSKELSYEECVDIVLGILIPKNMNNIGYERFPKEVRSKELKKRLGPAYIKLSKSAIERYNKTSSFAYRCLGLELASPVLKYSAGTKLTPAILEDIDNSDVDTLYVIKNSRPYELKKYKIGNTSLTIDEVCTELNMYINNLSGFGYLDNMFDDLNREIVTFDEAIQREVGNRLTFINEHLNAVLISPDLSLTNLNVNELGKYDFYSFIKKCKTEFKHSQGAETTNGISFIGKKSKVVIDYSGKTNEDIISIKASHQSAYDLLHIPESLKIGLVSHVTMASKVGDSGLIMSPYLPMKKGLIQSREPVYLTPIERQNKVIAPWDSDLNKDRIKCYFNGRVITVTPSEAEYIEYSALQTVSLASALIPFSQFSDGKRVVMGCSQNKQAVPCLASEAPLVSTGALSFDSNASELVIRAINILNSMYFSNKLDSNPDVDYDEFLKQTIKLIHIDHSKVGYRGHMFEVNYKGTSYTDVTVTPFAKKGSDDTMFHFYLNYRPGMVFSDTDIVLYNNSIDINKYDLVKHIDMGQVEYEDVLFDFDTALGHNYPVAYKTSGLPNMDDGICMSDEVLGTGILANVKIVEFKEELKNFKAGVTERFGIDNETTTHTIDGLPKVGTTLKPKSNVIGKTVIKDGVKTIRYSKLEMDREGDVIYAEIVGHEAVVGIATIADAEVGDKLAGDHGNKGVIGRIVPAKDMPFMEDGTKIQVTLNPLGIPSRMNFAQLYVALIGYAMKLQGKRMILSSNNPKSYEIAKEYLKDPKLAPQQLYDGRTCLPFDRKTTVGYIYLKKQTHTARSKVNSCAAPTAFNVVTNQPNKGKSQSGGQTMGEMETWTLEALGCRNFLQELFTVKSDYVEGREKLVDSLKNGELYEGDMVGSNIHAVQTFLRLMCCDLVLENGKYVVKMMKDEDIRSLAITSLKNTKEATQDNNVFGPSDTPKSVDFSKSRWSYLDLDTKIIHPNWIYKSDIPNLVIHVELVAKDDGEVEEKIGPLSAEKIKSVIAGNYFLDFSNGKILGSRNAQLLDSPQVGISPVVTAFESCSLATARSFYENRKNRMLDSDDLYANLSKQELIYKMEVLLNTIDYLSETSNDLSDFVISSFPIMPKNYRYQMDGRYADFDIFYHRIMSAITVKDADKIYNKILEFTGLDNKVTISKDTKAKNIAEYFTGKNSDKHHGAIREDVISHIVSFSGRSVIVPGNIPLGYVGLPRQACYNLKRFELKHYLKTHYSLFEDDDMEQMLDDFIIGMEMGDVYRCLNAIQSSIPMEKDAVLKLIEDTDSVMRDLLSKTAVAIGRQPTLHEGSIKGLVPLMVEGHAIQIHTLLCSGFNADFDGDQMWYAMAHTKASIQELLTKAHPANGVFSSKNGDVNLTPTQDVILGIYLATMLHENVLDSSLNEKYEMENIRYFNDLKELNHTIEIGIVNNKDLICYTHTNGNKYLSTAGRIVFNSYLVDGFTSEPYTNNMNIKYINPKNYCNLKYDGLVKSESPTDVEKMIHFNTEDREGNVISKPFMSYGINDVIKEEVTGLDPDRILTFFDNLVEYGIESCIRSGITLHLDDFKDSKLKDLYANKYEELIKEWNTLYEIGLMPEEERKSLSIRAANYCSDRVKKCIMDDYDRNDNLFIIIDSGARGKAAQVMRSTGLIGIINKSNTEQMETPIMTGYKYGLDSSSVFIMANGTRHGVATVQKDTGKTGEMTRDTVFMSAGVRIVESDCGCGFVDIKVDYDSPITKRDSLANKRLKPGSELYKDTKFITRDGLINNDVIDYIFKNHISEVPLVDGTVVEVKYKVSKLFSNMMINKLGSDLKGMERGQVITPKTIEYIEKEQLKSIKARTILKCECKDGLCARCYGVLHNGRMLPPIGYAAGVIAGQSVGEPSTQLVLDTINSNGAGNSGASAIDICKAIIAGSDTERFKRALIAPHDMHVVVEDDGKQSILDLMTSKYKVDRSDLNIIDGEKVHAGQILSKGIVNVKDLPSSLDDFLYVRMFNQLSTLFYLFYNSNVGVDARHFEVMVKSQLNYVSVFSSDCPSIKAGQIYPYSEVEQKIKEGYHIDYFNKPLKKTERILTVSGPMTALCHHDPYKIIGKISVNPSVQNDKISFVGALFTGSSVVNLGSDLNQPIAPRFEYKSSSAFNNNSIEDKEEEIESIFKVEEYVAPVINFDINSLLNNSEEFLELQKELSLDVVEEPSSKELSNSSFFSDSPIVSDYTNEIEVSENDEEDFDIEVESVDSYGFNSINDSSSFGDIEDVDIEEDGESLDSILAGVGMNDEEDDEEDDELEIDMD